MKTALWLVLLVGFAPWLRAVGNFPGPTEWSANLENVKISDVIAEISPASEIGGQVEAKFKSVLKAKGFLYKKGEGDFAILTPTVICRPPFVTDSTAAPAPPVCQIGLYLREHVIMEQIPKVPVGKRFPAGIVGTYYAHYLETFPPDAAITTKALDFLLDRFLTEVARQKSPPR